MNWRDGPRLPVAAAGGFAASLPDEVVYAGGTSWRTGAKEYLDDVHIYKWRGNSWRAGPKLPSSLAYGACVVTPAGLEILGGLDGNASTDKCWRLDHKKHAWLPSGVLPRDAVLARAAVVRNEVYLFGGAKDAADLTTCTAEVLTRDSSGKWHTVGLMPQGAVANAASAVIGNMVYLFGGVSMPAAGKVLNHADVLRFDAAEHTWRRLAPLPEPNRGLTAVALDTRRILLVGGYTATQAEAEEKTVEYGFSSEAYVYDTRADQYLRVAALPFAAAGVALLKHGDRVIAIGGEDRMRGRTDRVHMTRV
jgi:N-acetylneuraminic acid mutarotase